MKINLEIKNIMLIFALRKQQVKQIKRKAL